MSDLAIPQQSSPLFVGKNQYKTWLDKAKPTDRLTIMKCIGDCDHRLKMCINKEIHVENVFAHVVELANDETGEVGQFPRLVLIDSDGVTFECVSSGVYRDLDALIWLYDNPPWNPPLVVTPKLIELDKGRNLLKLTLVNDNRTEMKPRKAK